MGERDQKKERTRRALADAALSLFTKEGYETVTMADVAAKAGVSRRTAFRYFESKEDLLMEHPKAWLRVFDAFVATHQHLGVSERIRRASHEVGAYIESDAVAVRRLFALSLAHPSIAARSALSHRRWIERITAELAPSHPREDRSAAQAQMLAAAIMGIINSACELWASRDQAIGPLLDAGFDLVAAPLRGMDSAPS